MTRFEDAGNKYLQQELQESEKIIDFLDGRNTELYTEYQVRAQEIANELESRQHGERSK